METGATPWVTVRSLLSGGGRSRLHFLSERSHAHPLRRAATDALASLLLDSRVGAEVEALRAAASGFFTLPADTKKYIGDFRHVGDPGAYAGYRDSDLEWHKSPFHMFARAVSLSASLQTLTFVGEPLKLPVIKGEALDLTSQGGGVVRGGQQPRAPQSGRALRR